MPESVPMPVVEAVSESALLVHLEQRIDRAVNARAQRLGRVLGTAALPGIEDIVPGYASVLVRFDPRAWQATPGETPHAALWRAIRPLWDRIAALREDTVPAPLHRIPVCYGGAAGMDLEDVARHCGIGTGEFIERHTAPEYRVAMLGFAPGFAYLLGLDPTLHMPRRAHPRTRVAAGSIGIGGAQTGIYPAELPGGWQLVGRTPLRLFDAANGSRPSMLQAGDRVRFESVGMADLGAADGAGR